MTARALTLLFPAALPRIALLSRLRDAAALAHQRRQLAALDGARLADLGLSTAQAHNEAARPFWDAPRAWRG